MHRTSRVRVLAPLVVVTVSILVAGSLFARTASPEPAATVTMTNTLSFSPQQVTIQAGETVEWKNTSVIVHTVTADPEEATVEESVQLPDGAAAFDSGDLDRGETFTHTFETPGTYRYFCIPHEGARMFGTVVVEAA